MEKTLARFVQAGWLRALDYHLALFVQELAGGDRPAVMLAAALVSRAVGEGHVCLPLPAAAEFAGSVGDGGIPLPDPDSWRQELLASGVVGRPGERTPLILDKADRLYLYRYFQYEQDVARAIERRALVLDQVRVSRAAKLLRVLFPRDQEPDWQRVAVALSLLKPLLIVSGGPGTGKTYTVARILALVQGVHGAALRIGLAAPTGKAAARMAESIGRAKQKLPGDLGRHIPEQAATLHRLLRYRPHRGTFGRNRNNLLNLDLLVVDEASMIDITLMAALVRALPEQARLILLGDRNQLASVEAGRLFADICGRSENRWSGELLHALQPLCGIGRQPACRKRPVDDCVVQLQQSHRFTEHSAIGTLATLVNRGSIGDRHWQGVPTGSDLEIVPGLDDDRLGEEILHGFRPVFQAETPGEALARLEGFRILCALRQGPAGVTAINRFAESILSRAGLVPGDQPWYRGRPVMISRNHYGLRLYNGDYGIVWPDRSGRLRAWFDSGDGTLRPFSPARLPEHETGYAVTVHKAQGSEFDRVLLVLPDEDVPLLTRELVYTGITRARHGLVLCGRKEMLERAVQRRIRRFSGLADLLRTGAPQEGHRNPCADTG